MKTSNILGSITGLRLMSLFMVLLVFRNAHCTSNNSAEEIMNLLSMAAETYSQPFAQFSEISILADYSQTTSGGVLDYKGAMYIKSLNDKHKTLIKIPEITQTESNTQNLIKRRQSVLVLGPIVCNLTIQQLGDESGMPLLNISYLDPDNLPYATMAFGINHLTSQLFEQSNSIIGVAIEKVISGKDLSWKILNQDDQDFQLVATSKEEKGNVFYNLQLTLVPEKNFLLKKFVFTETIENEEGIPTYEAQQVLSISSSYSIPYYFPKSGEYSFKINGSEKVKTSFQVKDFIVGGSKIDEIPFDIPENTMIKDAINNLKIQTDAIESFLELELN